MKLILIKIGFLFAFLIPAATSFAQVGTFIKFQGMDSVSLEIKIDTAGKKVSVYRVNLKNDSVFQDTFRLAKIRPVEFIEPNKFKTAISKNFKNDSLSSLVADTTKKLLLAYKNFKIEVSLPDTGKAVHGTEVKSDTTSRSTATSGNGLFQPLFNEPVLGVLFIVLVLAVAGLAFMLYRQRQGRTIQQDVLPESLLKTFPEIKKKDDIEEAGRRIRDAFYDLKREVDTQKADIEKANAQIKDLKTERDALKKSLQAADQTIKDKEKELAETTATYQAFNERADKLLDKYFRELSRTLEQNNVKDKDEAYRLILTRLLPFSLHSASILKKQIKDATELDSMNIQLLEGDHPKPNNIVTDNTQFGHVDPLAYYIYHLLKHHQVDGLPDVFVKGCKIGN